MEKTMLFTLLLLHTIFTTSLSVDMATIGIFYDKKAYDYPTVMQNGTEVRTSMEMTPTRVIRAIRALIYEIGMEAAFIVTERRFENIAREWTRELRIDYGIYSRYIFYDDLFINYVPIDLMYRLYSMAIILLTPEKLKHLTIIKTAEPYHEVKYYMIVGMCIPKFLRRLKYTDLEMFTIILPVNTLKWINNDVSERQNQLPVYLLQRTGMKAWNAFPFVKTQSHKLVEKNICPNDKLYGVLSDVSIAAFFSQNNAVAKVKDGKLTGIYGSILQYLKEYLDFTLYYIQRSPKKRLNYDFPWDMDYPVITLRTTAIHSHDDFWPELYKDGITLVGMKLQRSMTLSRLLSLFKLNVWIALLVTLSTINFCCLLLFDGSPSLTHHPRVKNKVMNKLMRLISFHSFIHFHMECQQGPTLPAKFLLSSLNILIFILSTAFLTKFSVEVLLRDYFPFQDIIDVCHYNGSLYVQFEVYDLFRTEPDLFIRRVSVNCHYRIIDAFYDTRNDVTAGKVECLFNGSCVLLAFNQFGSTLISGEINSPQLMTPEFMRPFSIYVRTFAFKNFFNHLIYRIREVGIIRLTETRYLTKKEGYGSEMEPIGFSNTYLTFAILGIGIVIAAVILFVEIMLHKFNLVIKMNG